MKKMKQKRREEMIALGQRFRLRFKSEPSLPLHQKTNSVAITSRSSGI